jgi:hypothetical protein
MNLQEQLNRIQEMMGINESNSPKDKMNNLIDKVGLPQAIKMVGIDKLLKIIDTTPIDLVRDYFINKQFSIKDFDNNTGGYDFNFIITDIDDEGIDESWVVDVDILDGSVTIDDETYDLWDSDLWQEDWWWEIQGEIDDIISYILNPYKPEDIDLEIMHNLR